MDAAQILAALAAPLPPDAVDWRVGSLTKDKKRGMALAYIDARTVQDRLAEVCGALWASDHTVSADGKKVTCRVGIKIDGEWIWRSNGAGETDYEAEKGSYSDAFKRAAVMWGIGRYLYDLPSPWVAVNEFKQIDPGEMAKLRAIAAGKAPTEQPKTPAKAAEAPKPPANRPAGPVPEAVANFYKRPSYEIRCAEPETFVGKFETVLRYVTTPDHLLQLEEDNKAALAELNKNHIELWRRLQPPLAEARRKYASLAGA
jgi:hypothetical protein